MRKYMTKYGIKELFYSSLDELKKAIKARADELSVTIKQPLFNDGRRSELDLEKGDASIPFGSEQNALSVLLLTVQHYEKSPSKHSIVDFFEQSYAIFVGQRIDGANKLLRCHALLHQYEQIIDELREKVNKYKELLKDDSEPNKNAAINIDFEIRYFVLPKMSTKLDEVREAITLAKACGNTSLASYLATDVLLRGQEAFEHLQFPANNPEDAFIKDLDKTVAEVEALTQKYNKIVETELVENIEV